MIGCGRSGSRRRRRAVEILCEVEFTFGGFFLCGYLRAWRSVGSWRSMHGMAFLGLAAHSSPREQVDWLFSYNLGSLVFER